MNIFTLYEEDDQPMPPLTAGERCIAWGGGIAYLGFIAWAAYGTYCYFGG